MTSHSTGYSGKNWKQPKCGQLNFSSRSAVQGILYRYSKVRETETERQRNKRRETETERQRDRETEKTRRPPSPGLQVARSRESSSAQHVQPGAVGGKQSTSLQVPQTSLKAQQRNWQQAAPGRAAGEEGKGPSPFHSFGFSFIEI